MNKLYTIIIASLLPMISFAQKKGKVDYVFQEVANVELDGHLKEWSLYQPTSAVWSFGISNIQDDLYVAVRIKDPQLQLEALRSGIFVNISYSEKKKDGARLVFPFVDREKLRALLQDDTREEGNLKQDMLTHVRGYYIQGFHKAVDGVLSLENQYGVKAVVRLDEQEGMIYEAKVPLDLIKFDDKKIAVQIGVNTSFMQAQQMNKQVQRMSTRSAVYGRGPVVKKASNPYKEETSVWVAGQIK